MPQHHKSQVTELQTFAGAIDDEADLKKVVKQSGGSEDEDDDLSIDEEDDDLEGDDQDEGESDEDQDEDLDDEDEDDEEKSKGILGNPLPKKSDLPKELHKAYDILAAQRNAQNEDYTKKTQELSAIKKAYEGPAQAVVEALAKSGIDLEQYANAITQEAERIAAGGNPADAPSYQGGTSPSTADALGEISLEEALESDERLNELGEYLAQAHLLSDEQVNELYQAYEDRQKLVTYAVNEHNRKFTDTVKQREERQKTQLIALKSDPVLGRIVSKNEQQLLAEAKRTGVSDLTMLARHLYFDQAVKLAQAKGKKQFRVSREKNLDVGDGDTGRYDVDDTDEDALDKAFREEGLHGMVKLKNRSLAGGRRR